MIAAFSAAGSPQPPLNPMSPPSLITSVYRIRYASGYYVGENIGGRVFYGTLPGKPFNNDTDFEAVADEMFGCLGEIIAVDFDGVDVLVSVNEADDHAA